MTTDTQDVPQWIKPARYELCKRCWKPMYGIMRNEHPARKLCEGCAPNKTKEGTV